MKTQATPKAPKVARKEPKTISALQKSTPKTKKAPALDPAVKKILKPRGKAAAAQALAPAAAIVELTSIAPLETPAIAAPLAAPLRAASADILAPAEFAAAASLESVESAAPPVLKMVTREVKAEQTPAYAQAKEEKSTSIFHYRSAEKAGVVKRFFQKIVQILGK